jgi:serine/threonine protein kinase
LADVWSLGIVFFELLLGKRIYEMIEGDKIPYLRKEFPPKDLLNKITNKKLRRLVEQMLEKDT